MAAGLIVYNDTGNIQITDMYQNFVLAYQGGGTLGANWTQFSTTGGPSAGFTVPNSHGFPPLIVFYSEGLIYTRGARLDTSNNTWVYGVAGPSATAAGTAFQWYAFVPQPNVTNANYGFEVRRADGSLAYGSWWKPLRVVGQIGTMDGNSMTFNGQGGRKYGVGHVINTLGQSSPVPSGTWRVNGTGTLHRTAGNQVIMEGKQIYFTNWGFNPGNTSYNQPRGLHLVVDLTDY